MNVNTTQDKQEKIYFRGNLKDLGVIFYGNDFSRKVGFKTSSKSLGDLE